MIAQSPAYHDHPSRRLLLNFPDTTLGGGDQCSSRERGSGGQDTGERAAVCARRHGDLLNRFDNMVDDVAMFDEALQLA